jgi:hypothetical protein
MAKVYKKVGNDYVEVDSPLNPDIIAANLTQNPIYGLISTDQSQTRQSVYYFLMLLFSIPAFTDYMIWKHFSQVFACVYGLLIIFCFVKPKMWVVLAIVTVGFYFMTEAYKLPIF